MKPNLIKFGRHLSGLLNKAGMSQRDLARKTDLNYVTINKLINGKFRNGYMPKQQSIEAIAKALALEAGDYLLLFRIAGKVPQRIIDEFIRNETFAETCWRECVASD